MKILLSIPDDLLKQIDEVCTIQHYERSEFIRNCIRGELFSTTKYPHYTVTDGKLDEKDLIPKPMTPTPIVEPGIKKVILTKQVFKGEPVFDNFITQKKIKLCKHGSALGNCKLGCK